MERAKLLLRRHRKVVQQTISVLLQVQMREGQFV